MPHSSGERGNGALRAEIPHMQLPSPCVLCPQGRTSPVKGQVFKSKPQTRHVGLYGPHGLRRGGKGASLCQTPLPVATQTLLLPNAGCSLDAQREGPPIPKAPLALAHKGRRGSQNARPHPTQHCPSMENGDILLHTALCHVLGTEGPCQALLPITQQSLLPACPCSSSLHTAKTPRHTYLEDKATTLTSPIWETNKIC